MSGCQKRVVHLSFYSSIEPRRVLMLKALKSRGWEVCVIAWARSGEKEPPEQFADLVDRWEYVNVKAPSWSPRLITRLPAYYREVRRAVRRVGRYELLILTHLWQLPLAPTLRGSRLYDASEMFSVDMSLYFGRARGLVRRLFALLEGLLVRRVDGVTTVDSRGRWLERFYRRWNDNVCVLWNVPSKLDEPIDEEVEKLSSLYSGRRVIAFVGGLMREKGFRVALEALSLLKDEIPDVMAVFIGPMKDDVRAVEELVATLGIEEKVRFTGWLSYREVLAHLRHSLIGLALHQEGRIYHYVSAGNGRKFFTYMQGGVAIVGPNFGEVGEAVRLADCGVLVNTENPEEVAGAVRHLLSLPEELSRLARNGREAFLNKFNWEREEQKFLDFVSRLVKVDAGTDESLTEDRYCGILDAYRAETQI